MINHGVVFLDVIIRRIVYLLSIFSAAEHIIPEDIELARDKKLPQFENAELMVSTSC